jgi:hypothetical protein
MVDALRECRRVLESGGKLIDLRPFHSQPAVEIMTREGVFVPGRVDDSGGAGDDIAADEAVAEAVCDGLFTLSKRTSFRFANYWETLDGLLAYAEEQWRDNACIPPFVAAGARRCVAGTADAYKIRIRREVHIAVYEKAPVVE